MRPFPLTVMSGGIDRLKVKGGAAANRLYDLQNAYITNAGTIAPREGTIRSAVLNSLTAGLMAQNGIFNVFSNKLTAVPAGYLNNILIDPNDATQAVKKIWFAKPFMGFPYVVAEFANGDVFHYWLQNNGTWTPSTVYQTGAIVIPQAGGVSLTAGTSGSIGYSNGDMATFGAATGAVSPPTIGGLTIAALMYTFASSHNASIRIAVQYTGTPPADSFITGMNFVGDLGLNYVLGATGLQTILVTGTSGALYKYWKWQDPGGNAVLPTQSTPFTVGQTYSVSVSSPFATGNGLAYQAVRDFPTQVPWTGEATVALNSFVEPNSYTGFAYKAVAIAGTPAHTGQIEPVWPTTAGGTVQEFGDFDTSNTDSGTTQASTATAAAPLGSNITDRYGNSSTISNSGGTSGTASTTVAASTKVTTWAHGTLYAPGAVVRPSTGQGAFTNAIPNGDFENGDDGNWIFSGTPAWAYSSSGTYQGVECIAVPGGSAISGGGNYARMLNFGVVSPGKSVTASAYLNPNNNGADLDLWVAIDWYDASDTFISEVLSAPQTGGGYRKTSVTAIAPPGAAHVRIAIRGGSGTSTRNTGYADLVTWSLEQPASVSNFLFEAVQASAGSSAATEPTWPTVAGATVIDNLVTWKAIGTSIITWQAIPIMRSGLLPPGFPINIGNTVLDPSTFKDVNGVLVNTTMSWTAVDRHISDVNDPNTKAVALAATHVFAGDKDIVPFSAAVDPTDWTSANNAGYLPTGLNNYGDNPVAVLTLYRSNLIAMNAGGYQMWQVDPDPANMALLDAQPVGSIWPRAAQSVANDLLFLTEVGVRNLGTVGATANMQIGNTGQPVDPLVKKQLQLGTYDPLSLYYPGRGQYWLIFGPQAFVLTINGNNQKTWARYIFPDSITDWALNAGVLYLRTLGNLVWQLDANTLVDDFGGANVGFKGVIQWPYIDVGPIGTNKMMYGVDIVGDGDVNLQIGFNQGDLTTFNDNAGFATSLNVTAPYDVNPADTVPGTGPIPIPVSAPSFTAILTFAANQAWTWEALILYFTDTNGAGALG